MSNSTLASLDSRATTESALASGKDTLGVAKLTGQYLFERFCTDGEQSKMDIVRWCVDHIEVAAFKTALKDMVAIAAKHSDAVKKTAQNHQSVMRTAYGAWRFAKQALSDLGGDDNTGYQAMRVLGRQALKQAGVKWDGTPAPTETDAAVATMDKAQAHALAEIRKDNPARDGETPVEWEARCRGILAANMAENDAYLAEIVEAQSVADLAAKVRKLCGDDLKAVLEHILNSEEFIVNEG